MCDREIFSHAFFHFLNRVSRRADWAVPDLKIGGSSQVLEFGGRGRFIAAANNVLGTGAYGTVYKGLDRLNGHAVAIKTENSRHPPCLLPNEIKYYLLLDEQREYSKSNIFLTKFLPKLKFPIFLQSEFHVFSTAVQLAKELIRYMC